MTPKIHHLNCGTLCPFCERLVNGSGSWTGRGQMVCHCLLVETDDGLVLIDTGFGTHDIEQPAHLGKPFLALTSPAFKRKETALAQVQALGFQRSDVRHIIVTHLDLDHAGGLPDFPDATVHVYKPEHTAAMHPSFKERPRYRPAHFSHKVKWNILEDGGDTWNGFKHLRPLPNVSQDIAMIPVIGHTRGHCAVAVRTGKGWIIHAGDAYFYHGQMEQNVHMPLGLQVFESMVQTLKDERIANQNRLRELVLSQPDTLEIFCAHDPVELARYNG